MVQKQHHPDQAALTVYPCMVTVAASIKRHAVTPQCTKEVSEKALCTIMRIGRCFRTFCSPIVVLRRDISLAAHDLLLDFVILVMLVFLGLDFLA